MRRTDKILAALALAGLSFSIPGTALAAGVAQSGGSDGGSAAYCRVQVKRNSSAGVFDVVRLEPANGR